MRNAAKSHQYTLPKCPTQPRQRDGGDIWPCVLASWAQNPETLAADRLYVGGKAAGLFKLPRQWVPPFLVLTKAFHSLWQTQRDVVRTMQSLADEDRALVREFFERLVPEHGGSSPRSSCAPTQR